MKNLKPSCFTCVHASARKGDTMVCHLNNKKIVKDRDKCEDYK